MGILEEAENVAVEHSLRAKIAAAERQLVLASRFRELSLLELDELIDLMVHNGRLFGDDAPEELHLRAVQVLRLYREEKASGRTS